SARRLRRRATTTSRSKSSVASTICFRLQPPETRPNTPRSRRRSRLQCLISSRVGCSRGCQRN
ncbi:uncharacterized protein METZ01_LOCUS166821, partial [marine metagenome]